MASPEEILVAFFAAHGNRRLTDGTAVPLDRLNESIRFWREGDEAPCAFDAWIASVTGFFAVDVVRIGGDLHCVALVMRRQERDYTVCRIETSNTPRTTLSGKDVLDYVDALAEHEVIRRTLGAWCDLVAALSARDGTPLSDEVSKVIASTEFSDELRRAWVTFKNAHRNPNYGLIFDLRHGESRADVPTYTDQAEARARLGAALDGIAAFADKEKLEHWRDYFQSAKRVLDGAPIDDWMAARFAGSSLDPDALSLLAAAWKADAFGGMGSWNDVGASDMETYGDVSQALFGALRPAMEAAINSSHQMSGTSR
jgi:hypothetical protein